MDTSDIEKVRRGLFFCKNFFMDEAIDLHFNFKNITRYLHPVLLCNISGWQEIDGTFIIKKDHGCKRRNRNSTRKFIEYFRGDRCSKSTGYPYWRKTNDK